MHMQQRLFRSLVAPCQFIVATAFLFAALGVLNATGDETDHFKSIIAPTLQTHCVKCHGLDGAAEGDVNLSSLSGESIARDPELLQSLIDVLEYEEMPPEDEPELDPSSRAELLSELDKLLESSIVKKTTFARTPIRRMNRFQYNNAVIDLFQLKVIVFTLPERMMREHGNYFQPATGKMAPKVTVGSRPLGKSQMIEPRLAGVAAFPQDLRAEHGFDNRGDHLSLSPLLMEAFLSLGESITQSPDFNETNVGIWNAFFAKPAESSNLHEQLTTRLETFLTTAFRRPVDANTLDRYVTFAERRIATGDDFTNVMKDVASAVIASPRFLYLYEFASENKPTTEIDDLELASRMSFFLWGSIPDTTLMELAMKGELHQPEVYDSQIDRMLKDRKLKRFCDSFPSQWLQLERIISSVPNPKKFRRFYFAKFRESMHMMLEPLLLFETVLIEDLPITQLIDSDFTYRSAALEGSYKDLASDTELGKRGRGSPIELVFHRLPIHDRRSGGVITNAAVMTMTSGPNRTKPITRGAWVATVIFNDPPDPPPANVPALDEKPSHAEEHLTLRERLSLHRQRSDCKGCHEQIDPLGFALENFDPVGVWRDEYANGRSVDMSGQLFRKHEFSNVVEFKDAILNEKDRFTRGLAGHLLSFALARELTVADRPALDEISEATAAENYKMKTLIKQVMMCEPFHSKTSPQSTPDTK